MGICALACMQPGRLGPVGLPTLCSCGTQLWVPPFLQQSTVPTLVLVVVQRSSHQPGTSHRGSSHTSREHSEQTPNPSYLRSHPSGSYSTSSPYRSLLTSEPRAQPCSSAAALAGQLPGSFLCRSLAGRHTSSAPACVDGAVGAGLACHAWRGAP
eukprot:scaffold173593_cov15-Tisochrysis_lutea.AAC.1